MCDVAAGPSLLGSKRESLVQPNLNSENMIVIDGSLMEGGGQVIRTALSLSFLLGDRSLALHSIRAGRVDRGGGGLKSQHLESVRLAAKLGKRTLSNDFKGSCELLCEPQSGILHVDVVEIDDVIEADTKTAGALTLILQAALPPLIFTAQGVPELRLLGGTDVDFSPPIAHFQIVLAPLLQSMGVDITCHIVKRGFYPNGGGEVQVKAKCSAPSGLKPIKLVERGDPTEISVNVAMSPGFEADVSSAFVDSCETKLRALFPDLPLNLSLESLGVDHSVKKPKKSKKQVGSVSVQIAISTSTGCILSCNYLRTQSKIDADWTDKYLLKLLANFEALLESHVCVDEHTADQLIVWMALASGTSAILAPPASAQTSQHLETVIHFAQVLTGASFRVTHTETMMLIECSGIGLQVS